MKGLHLIKFSIIYCLKYKRLIIKLKHYILVVEYFIYIFCKVNKRNNVDMSNYKYFLISITENNKFLI